MFALVADIESYPQFLPFCTRACVLSRDGAYVQALLELSKGRIHKAFTTRNRLVPDEMIEMHFEFSNRLMGMAFGPVFHPLLNGLMDAFVRRAQYRYGHGGD